MDSNKRKQQPKYEKQWVALYASISFERERGEASGVGISWGLDSQKQFDIT